MYDVDYIKSDPQKWYKSQNYSWQRDRVTPNGALSEYDPLKTPREIYEDFYQLIKYVEIYRKYFEIFGHGLLKRMHLKRGINRKNYEDSKSNLINQYTGFVNRWGLLGNGFSRIISTSREGERSGILFDSGKVKRLILREADTELDLDLPKLYKLRPLMQNVYESILPDRLPVSGGPVPLSLWERDYTHMSFCRYSESLNALAGCRELLLLLNDINDHENAEEIVLHPNSVSLEKSETKWRFNSLIQAIMIIHSLNKSRQLPNPWGICLECKELFDIKNNHQRRYCSDSCRDKIKKRNYRAKKIMIYDDFSTDV